jgi:hypothetical protein
LEAAVLAAELRPYAILEKGMAHQNEWRLRLAKLVKKKPPARTFVWGRRLRLRPVRLHCGHHPPGRGQHWPARQASLIAALDAYRPGDHRNSVSPRIADIFKGKQRLPDTQEI